MTNKPIQYALIKFNSKNYSTDIEGKFKIPIENIDLDTSHIKVSYIAYETQILSLKPFNINNIVVKLAEQKLVLQGELLVIKPKKWWQFWK